MEIRMSCRLDYETKKTLGEQEEKYKMKKGLTENCHLVAIKKCSLKISDNQTQNRKKPTPASQSEASNRMGVSEKSLRGKEVTPYEEKTPLNHTQKQKKTKTKSVLRGMAFSVLVERHAWPWCTSGGN